MPAMTRTVLSLFAAFVPQAAQPPTFKADTKLVQTEVQVLEPRTNRPITGLSSNDFVVTDNGKVSPVKALDTIKVPLEAVIAVDTSGTFRNAGPIRCAEAFLPEIEDSDRIAVVSFDRNSTVRLRLTKDKDSITAAFLDAGRDRNHSLIKATRLYDALSAAVGMFDGPTHYRRRVVIALTHDREQRSREDVQGVIDQFLRRSAGLHAITMPEEYDRLKPWHPPCIICDTEPEQKYSGARVVSAGLLFDDGQ